MNEIITLEDYLSSSGKYKDRMNSPECTDEVKENAKILLEKVNNLLKELGINECNISSGFRTQAANDATKNAAKKSLHCEGKAVDILDNKEQFLGNLILKHSELLNKYQLWMEDLNSTKGIHTNWVHLDIGIRSERQVRVFKP